MARTGKKNRELACKHVTFELAPTWDKTSRKFETPIPVLKVLNAEVIDEEDGEFGLKLKEHINLEAQIEAGLLTTEEVTAVFDTIRKAWNNVELMQEPTQ